MLVDHFDVATPSSCEHMSIMHGATLEPWQMTNYKSAGTSYSNNASQVPECEGAKFMEFDNETK